MNVLSGLYTQAGRKGKGFTDEYRLVSPQRQLPAGINIGGTSFAIQYRHRQPALICQKEQNHGKDFTYTQHSEHITGTQSAKAYPGKSEVRIH